jgi:hypothetical protein
MNTVLIYSLLSRGFACWGGWLDSCFPAERAAPAGPERASFSEMMERVRPIVTYTEIEVEGLLALEGFEEISKQPRIEARCSSGMFDSLDRRIRNACSNQILSDRSNPQSTPLLRYDGEFVPINGKLERLTVGETLANSRNSVVLGVRSRPDLVMKYQANCDGLYGIHPLINDFAFLKHLEGLGLSPRAQFLSPAVKFVLPITTKTHFEKTLKETMECIAENNSAVRYLVMERVRESVTDIINDYLDKGSTVPLKIAAQITRSTIQGLQKMHSIGKVIHGDIHMGNVVVLSREPWQAGFIDFGLSSFGDYTFGKESKIHGPRFACLDSPFQMEGHRPGYRDDVYRAILMMSMMLNGPAFLEYCFSLELNPAAMTRFKTRGNFFYFEGKDFEFPDVTHLHVSLRGLIEDRLSRLITLVREDVSESPDQKPDYRAIIALIDHIIQIV